MKEAFLINRKWWTDSIDPSWTVFPLSSDGALQLSCQFVWLTVAADIKHYWIFPKTSAVRFWNLIQLMKANADKRGGSASNVLSLRAEINQVLSGRQTISRAIRENCLVPKSKHQRGSQSLTESNFKIHFIHPFLKIILFRKQKLTFSMILLRETIKFTHTDSKNLGKERASKRKPV